MWYKEINWNKFYFKTFFSLQIVSSTDSSGDFYWFIFEMFRPTEMVLFSLESWVICCKHGIASSPENSTITTFSKYKVTPLHCTTPLQTLCVYYRLTVDCQQRYTITLLLQTTVRIHWIYTSLDWQITAGHQCVKGYVLLA